MSSSADITKNLLNHSFNILDDNLKSLSLEEALFIPPGGYRSILGTLKHTAAWSHVYRSFAFDNEPTHWRQIDWPRGLRTTIVATRDYLEEIIAWLHLSHQNWLKCLNGTTDEEFVTLRPLHWGEMAPLNDIVRMIANHIVYHAGEINQLLSICRQEAWEEGEEVEENHISTEGHRVIPPWLE